MPIKPLRHEPFSPELGESFSVEKSFTTQCFFYLGCSFVGCSCIGRASLRFLGGSFTPTHARSTIFRIFYMVFADNKPMGCIMDQKPFVNVLPFGKCNAVPFPPTPCVPSPIPPHIPKIGVLVGTNPAIEHSTKTFCALGGMIEGICSVNIY